MVISIPRANDKWSDTARRE